MLITPATRPLVGALIGDITGSAYEWNNVKTIHFDLFHPKCYFTDDSVLAMAVADALMQGRDFGEVMHAYGRAWPGRGYGENFELWLESDRPEPYGSYGNGSAMRVAAVAAACDSLDSIRPTYVYDVTCQGTVPPAVVAFLESQDFEHAIRLAISIGGDSDTLACITGSIAAAFYPDIPQAMTAFAERLLPEAFLLVLQHFDRFVGKG